MKPETNDFFSYLDKRFARFIAELNGTDNPSLFLASALVSYAASEGHICLDLSLWASKEVQLDDKTLKCPELATWIKDLNNASVIGAPGEFKPLILDQRRLYLHRFWQNEHSLLENIRTRVNGFNKAIEAKALEEGLERLFPSDVDASDVNWQKVSAYVALHKSFSVISGGPGTGKTTTVVKILVLRIEQAARLNQKIRIALAAPTGKAAARLQESIRQSKTQLQSDETVKQSIPDNVSTLHRLLGANLERSTYRYHADNPLPFDMVVVDEASMVDLLLMARLFTACLPTTQIVLLGDRDQLSSVEAGAALGDICDGELNAFSADMLAQLKTVTPEKALPQRGDSHEIGDCIVQLKKNYRFGQTSGIYKLSLAVKNGDPDKALAILEQKSHADVCRRARPSFDALQQTLNDSVVNGFKDYLQADNPKDALALFDRFRILCAIRKGPYGVERLNLTVEHILKNHNLIDPSKQWYQGRPVMIVRNDYHLNLFNGDIGVALPDNEGDHDLRVFFFAQDGGVKKLLPRMLPAHETVYAMTVHKSQGSEFQNVLLILPESYTEILTRELIYTGLTRAKETAEIWADETIFRQAVGAKTMRTSGLRQALWSV
jgi:exodeoxyribonuclease V alpha subunit